jgi:hypothetical protein
MNPHQGHAPPPNFDPSIYNESNPHPDFAAQQQPYYYQSEDHPNNNTKHQLGATGSIQHTTSFTTNTADLSMAELHHIMTDPNQSILTTP